MVESGRADPGRDAILATKVSIPRVRSGLLNRSRLITTLDEAVRTNLTLVCTPAGFGKTTLLADWAQHTGQPVAWLSLDEGDNDSTRFWRYVVAALEAARSRAGSEGQAPFVHVAGASSEGMATAIVYALEAMPSDLVLVLDDYHAVRAPAVHHGMEVLLAHQPPRLHLVVASRADPPLPIARLRGRDQLAELRARDLRFTVEEAAAFLADVWQVEVSPDDVAALVGRTEGWAVGLQLAALSLKDRPDRDAFIAAFSGTHRYVLDYLSDEVFGAQPDQVRAFLLQTSILHRLCGPLCDAVTGRADGQAMLEGLERANLFVNPLDEERRWYRFHQLFADMLRARLQQTDAARVAELHRRAAGWLAGHDLIDEAIDHVLAAGDPEWAGDLVESALNDAFGRSERGTVARWLSRLPDELVQERPRLGIGKAMLAWHFYRLDEMERALEATELAVAGADRPTTRSVGPQGATVPDLRDAISLLRAQLVVIRGDATAGREHLHAAMAHITEAPPRQRVWASWLLHACDWIEGRMHGAEEAFAEMLAAGRATPNSDALMTSVTTLGQIQEARGRLSAALRTYEAGLRFTRDAERRSPVHDGEAHLGIARVLYQRNEIDAALRHASEGVELMRRVTERLLHATGLQTLAWIRQAMGETDAAVAAMDESIRLIPSPNVTAWRFGGHAGRARLLLAQGRLEEARQSMADAGSRDDNVSYPRERDHLTLAHLLLADADSGRAAALLERLDDIATAHGRDGNLIEIRAVRALALDAAGEPDAAFELIGQAIALARPEDYVRVFVDEGERMARLLRRLAGATDRTSTIARPDRVHLNRVLRAFVTEDDAAPAAPLIEPLTDREFEVLRLVAAGRRNSEIAGELWVSVDTVKKHMTHILGKLAVSNRTEAVAEARELGLIGRSK